jgi:hypothetical protein
MATFQERLEIADQNPIREDMDGHFEFHIENADIEVVKYLEGIHEHVVDLCGYEDGEGPVIVPMPQRSAIWSGEWTEFCIVMDEILENLNEDGLDPSELLDLAEAFVKQYEYMVENQDFDAT